MIGQTLSHFKIIAKLGEGGMGEVYRAEDTKLGREEAIKVLPAALTEDPERLARFEREARVLASLNHPNIAAIYEVGVAPRSAEEGEAAPSNVHFLAMELAEGEDLAARLTRGPIGLDAAIPIAHQVASALEAAHERGIVHRDLKPANVMVGVEGPSGPTVKVLDFGLAKAWDGESRSDTDLSLSPTLTAQMTQAGVILGTASYMSPEQARGQAVDRRADIWAFGVMFLEIVTGKRTFEGETTTDVLAAVLRADPDFSGVAESVPRRLLWLLRRCLEKDPQRRLRDIGEARILLDDLLHGTGEATEEEIVAVPTPSGAAARRPWRWVAGLILVIGALSFFLGRTTAPPAPVTFGSALHPFLVRKLTFHPGLQHEPAVSPDGNYVAYSSNEGHNLDIVVLPLAGGSHTPVVTHPADDAQPAWSPDGTQLAFTSARDHGGRLSVMTGTGRLTQFIFSVGGDIFLVPALGGAPVKLIENGAHPAWSADGSQIAFESDRSGYWNIWTVPSRGGAPTQLTDDPVHDFQPAFSPDGRWLVYGSLEGLAVIPAAGGKPIRLTDRATGGAGPAWSPDGKSITFSVFRGGRQNLWRLSFDPDTGRSSGVMERVSLGEGDDVEAAYGPDADTIAYATVRFVPDIWELDPSTGEARQVTNLSSHDDYPHLGPDGETLLIQSTRGGEEAIWACDRSGESMRKITPDGVVAREPRWSPDGTSLVYQHFNAETGGSQLIIQRPGELTGHPIEAGVSLIFPVWSPDGRRLAASEGLTDIFVVDVETGESVKLTDSTVEYGFPTWSADGEWLAYNRRGKTGREVWLMRSDGSEARRLSNETTVDLSHPQWSPTNADHILVVVDHENLGILSATSGELTPLTDYDDSTIVVDYPAWSVDGTLIHYSLARRRGDVYLMAPDSTPK